MYPHKIPKAGIKYATYERNIGPALEIIWNLNWNAIAVGNNPKYIIVKKEVLLNYEG